ncbi:NADPH-dependent F420 reductase [Spirosoma radiotolerans]|uniref:NADP oxidoreductase n=1 Tax=Spirosoma radiotolerans TaxID=1379870 RepID=A0A0E3ZSG1_9BACT|nr:NADPH-dependent F420 reductase [Spirosoma radiotolerans]AKD54110.1 NADP oxidoreductase [Spirosoma radiotolerans]
MSTSTTTSIGIIGAGNIAQGFARHVAKAGYPVMISNSRGPESLADLVTSLGNDIKAGTVTDAAQADIVLLALPWQHLSEGLAGLPAWNGRIVIDATNFIVFPEFKPADLGDRTSSEVVAELVPGARLVKAFNTLDAAVLAADPHQAGGQRVLFFSGDDKEAKETVSQLIKAIGFAGIDLGGLVTGGKLQQFGGPLPTHNLIKLPK